MFLIVQYFLAKDNYEKTIITYTISLIWHRVIIKVFKFHKTAGSSFESTRLTILKSWYCDKIYIISSEKFLIERMIGFCLTTNTV